MVAVNALILMLVWLYDRKSTGPIKIVLEQSPKVFSEVCELGQLAEPIKVQLGSVQITLQQ